MDTAEKRYLELLSRSFPSAAKASAEIINLSAVLESPPKGPNSSLPTSMGNTKPSRTFFATGRARSRLKIGGLIFGDTLSAEEKRSLASLIYYPRERMELVLSQVEDHEKWFVTVLPQLVSVCKRYRPEVHAVEGSPRTS